MNDNNISQLHKPEPTDLLQQVLKKGAQQLLAQAIEAEVQQLLADHKSLLTEDGKTGLVRNGYLPERTIQTGLGDIGVKVPKVRDRTGQGIKFNSSLVPPYLKRSQSVEEFLPWLYLRGISTGDFSESLKHLLGEEAKGLSAATISRLKASWESDFTQWQKRDLSKKRYVYVWADGVYCNVRMGDKVCLLVIIGSDELGNKELIAVSDGYRESEESWSEVLLGLKQRGLSVEPKVAVGDGALGFWKALAKCWPTTRGQRCWVHKTANVLAKFPKAMQPKVKSALHEIWQSETKEEASELIQTHKKQGASLIKVVIDEIPIDSPQFSDEMLQHIAQEAGRQNLLTVAHIGTEKEMLKGLNAGIKVFVHNPYRSTLSEEALMQVKDAQAIIIPTNVVFENLANFYLGELSFSDYEKSLGDADIIQAYSNRPANLEIEPSIDAWFKEVVLHRQDKIDHVKRMMDVGIPILAGSDSPNVATLPGSSLHKELALWVEKGNITPQQALSAATYVPGQLLHKINQRNIGYIAKGFEADLLLIDGNPLKNIRDSQKIQQIILSGKLIKNTL